MELLGLTYNEKTSWNLLVLAVAISLCCVGLALWKPVSLAVMLGAVFVGVFFSSRTFRWVVFPAVFAFNQMIYARWGMPIVYGNLVILPSDWMALLLFVAVLLNKVLSGEKLIERTGIEKPTAIFLGAIIVVSLFGTVSINAAAIGIGHIILYFLTFYAMVVDWRNVPAKYLWRTFQFWAIPVAISIVLGFFITGGGRSLGISFNLRFSDLILPVICFQLVALTLRGGIRRLLFMGLFVLVVVTSQTRGAWISTGAVVIAWVFIRIFLKDRSFKIRLVQTTSAIFRLAIILIMIFLIFYSLLGKVEERATQLVSGSGTVILRLFLWGLALKLFLLHPITGIGLWQFANVVQQLPEVKNISIFLMVHGLSTHNSFLQLLVETGIIGAITFLFFCFVVLRWAWSVALLALTQEQRCLGWGIFLSLFFFITSTFFAEAWIMYPFMFFLALMVIFERQLNRQIQLNNGD